MLNHYRYISLILFCILYSTYTSKKAITRPSKDKKPENPKKTYQRLSKPTNQEDLEKSINMYDFVFVYFYDKEFNSYLETMKHLLKIKNTKFFKKSKVYLYYFLKDRRRCWV